MYYLLFLLVGSGRLCSFIATQLLPWAMEPMFGRQEKNPKIWILSNIVFAVWYFVYHFLHKTVAYMLFWLSLRILQNK